MAGVAISANGDYIAADMQNKLYFFNKESNKPLWTKDTESSALGVDMSDDGSLIALGVANLNGKGDKILVYDIRLEHYKSHFLIKLYSLFLIL